jgi:hypothetical protein
MVEKRFVRFQIKRQAIKSAVFQEGGAMSDSQTMLQLLCVRRWLAKRCIPRIQHDTATHLAVASHHVAALSGPSSSSVECDKRECASAREKAAKQQDFGFHSEVTSGAESSIWRGCTTGPT